MATIGYFEASETPEVVDIEPMRALAIEGVGAPGGPAHMDAIRVLYEAANNLAHRTAQGGQPFELPPMEGLWWVEDERPPFEVPRDEWHWQLLLQIPSGVPVRDIATGDRVKLVEIRDGLSVQALHVGPYSAEPETLAKMDALMKRERLEPAGRHHEIYLTPVTDEPSEGRTILRQPVRRSAA
jgi:hypothetical protein